MRISDVANRIGIPISTIRYYEKRAVIREPNRHGRNRSYSEQDVRAIQFVRDAQSLGISLSDISALIQNDWSKGELAMFAERHRETVREQIKALHRVDKVLSSLVSCTCNGFADCDLTSTDCKHDD